MSLPNSGIPSSPSIPSAFEYSLFSEFTVTDTEDYELGGVAIQDPSQGYYVKIWRGRISHGARYLLIGSADTPDTMWYDSGGFGRLTEVSLAFDQNMRPILAFVEAGAAKFQWYDTAIEQQVVTTLASDVRNPRVSMDEKRADFGTTNDVILSYLRGQNLYVRVGRDRYTIEYLIQSDIPEGYSLHKTGMNLGLRFQWEFRKPWDAGTSLDYYLANAADPGTDVTPPEQAPSTEIPGLDS